MVLFEVFCGWWQELDEAVGIFEVGFNGGFALIGIFARRAIKLGSWY